MVDEKDGEVLIGEVLFFFVNEKLFFVLKNFFVDVNILWVKSIV